MRHPTKHFLTTKHTTATKVSDINILKLLNFVLFACLSLGRQVTFVVKVAFSSHSRLDREKLKTLYLAEAI